MWTEDVNKRNKHKLETNIARNNMNINKGIAVPFRHLQFSDGIYGYTIDN